MLRNIHGKIIIYETEKLRIWKEYTEKLYGNIQADTTKLFMTRDKVQNNIE